MPEILWVALRQIKSDFKLRGIMRVWVFKQRSRWKPIKLNKQLYRPMRQDLTGLLIYRQATTAWTTPMKNL